MRRLFIAIPVPPLKNLLTIYGALRRLRPQVRPVHPDLLHLTLRFLGETPTEQIPAVEDAVRSLAGFGPLELRLTGLGRFPHVIYAGVEPHEPLAAMADALDAKLPGRDRPFTPHLTLARLRRGVRREALAGALAPFEDQALGHLSVKAVHLIESRLDGRPRYLRRFEQRLGGSRG